MDIPMEAKPAVYSIGDVIPALRSNVIMMCPRLMIAVCLNLLLIPADVEAMPS